MRIAADRLNIQHPFDRFIHYFTIFSMLLSRGRNPTCAHAQLCIAGLFRETLAQTSVFSSCIRVSVSLFLSFRVVLAAWTFWILLSLI